MPEISPADEENVEAYDGDKAKQEAHEHSSDPYEKLAWLAFKYFTSKVTPQCPPSASSSQ